MDIKRICAFLRKDIIFLFTLCQLFSTKNATSTNSDITLVAAVKATPIKQGEVLAFLCHVEDIKPGYNVQISRMVDSTIDRQVLSFNEGLLMGLDDRIFLAVRKQGDGSTSYLLSITNVELSDVGQYVCTVASHDREAKAYEEIVHVDILYFPSDSNLECLPKGSFSVLEGSSLSVSCSSDIGNPPVNIEWIRTGSPDITTTSNSILNNTVLSTFNVSATLKDNGVVFMCKFTSVAFPDESSKQSCVVGPLNVIPARSRSTVSPGPSLTEVTDVSPKTVGHLKCKSCSTHPSTLYWIAAGVVSGILALILFIGDILLMIKLKKLRGAWGVYKAYSLTPSVAETNYMYLPRSALEGNRMYMTLERSDPQQPAHHYSEEVYGPPTPIHYAMTPTNETYTESHV